MLKKSISFIEEEGKKLVFTNKVNVININNSPFKEIMDNGNYLSYTLIFNNLEEYKISLEETFHLLVNVKEIGSFHFFFLSKFFEKYDVINQILGLKDKESSKEKIDLLFNLLKDKNILFVVYIARGEKQLSVADLETYQENVFYYKDEKREEQKEIVQAKEPAKEKKGKKSFLDLLKNFFSPIIEDKIKFVFIFIAAVIIGFTLSIGIFDYYLDNKIYIFFFVFSLIGGIFNFIVFKDYFRERRFGINDGVISLFVLFLGYLLSIGFYFLFYDIAKNKPETLTNSATPVYISIPIFIGLEVASILLARIITWVFKKDIKKEEEE